MDSIHFTYLNNFTSFDQND